MTSTNTSSIKLRRLGLGLGLSGLVAAGCDPGGGGVTETPEGIQSRLVLESFTNCGDLERYIEDTAVRDMRYQLDNLKRQGGVLRGGVDDAAGAPQAESKGPAAYTTTNNQVAGVDEADFVKNDGTRIFVLSGQTLYASRSWPAAATQLAGKLAIEGYPQQMFLDDKNRVVVFSSVYTRYREDDPALPGGGAPCGLADAWGCGYGYSNTVKVTVIDVSDLSALRVIDEHYLPGSYNDARRIGSSVRLVLSDSFRWPAKLKWYPEWDENLWNDKPRLSRVIDQMKVENEALIRAQSLEQWFPKGRRRLADGKVVEAGYSCSDFSRGNAPVHLGLVTVATLNLDGDGSVGRTAIVAEPGQVYASHDALYVATQHWWWWPLPGQRDYTYLHKFDIKDPNKAAYVASGGVDGHILDQFSLDEHKGYLRVATTIATRVPDPKNPENTWGLIETTNRVSVLGETAGRLSVTGASADVSKGQRVYSSRFMGDRAFVVTFQQVDPLHSFDMSNPRAPREVGELKVPGFSTYLHPVDDRHLLAMGVYMPDPNGGMVDWRERRMKLTLFDVGDLSAPQEKFGTTIGTAYGWSEAAYEHKAFNYFPCAADPCPAGRNILAIPFSDYQNTGNYWDSFISELRLFSVDTATGIQARGAMNMKDVYQTYGDKTWTWYWSPWIRRSVMARDDAGNTFAYAISDGGIRVADLRSPGTPLATVRFNKAGR